MLSMGKNKRRKEDVGSEDEQKWSPLSWQFSYIGQCRSRLSVLIMFLLKPQYLEARHRRGGGLALPLKWRAGDVLRYFNSPGIKPGVTLGQAMLSVDLIDANVKPRPFRAAFRMRNGEGTKCGRVAKVRG